MRRLVLVLTAAMSIALLHASAGSALGLKIAPLRYDAELAKGEVKKGYVDISNPESVSLRVKLDVEAFRQINDEGALAFYEDERVSKGITLDFDTITIGPREAYRVYFLIDGAKLAEGDNFAAIFASTIPSSSDGSQQAVRVGTILTITNGTPPSRQATITSFMARWLQIGDGLSAQVSIRNTSEAESSGFYPSIQAATSPYGVKTVKGPLIFADRTRTVELWHPGSYFGPVWLGARVGDTAESSIVFAVTGYWRWLAPIIFMVVGASILVISRLYRRPSSHKR